MRTKPVLTIVLAAAAAVSLLGQARPAKTKKADPDMVAGPLIRMDLLALPAGAPAVPKRDPFVPGVALAGGDEDDRPRVKIPFPGPGGAAAKPAAAVAGATEGEEGTVPVPAANIRYVGFVQGREAFLALVLFNGQATAVSAGEALGNAWKVIKAGPSEIEVQAPDGSNLKFALEGERK